MFKSLFEGIDFHAVHVHVDLGFLGIKKFLNSTEISIPHKASKLHPLTKEQEEENCNLSRKRVVVENSIAGIKRHFILRIKNRMHIKEKLDHAVELCTMLWNLKGALKAKKLTTTT